MSQQIKAIETQYKGYRFRSRLEARWAVFFDSLGIKWEYEKEGYELPSGWYLPDFWLPDDDLWVEIKGDRPTDMELRLLEQLASATEKHAFLFHGIPTENKGFGVFLEWYDEDEFCSCEWRDVVIRKRYRDYKGYAPDHCVLFVPEFNAVDPFGQQIFFADDQSSIFSAASDAKSARFEHGESPDNQLIRRR